MRDRRRRAVHLLPHSQTQTRTYIVRYGLTRNDFISSAVQIAGDNFFLSAMYVLVSRSWRCIFRLAAQEWVLAHKSMAHLSRNQLIICWVLAHKHGHIKLIYKYIMCLSTAFFFRSEINISG